MATVRIRDSWDIDPKTASFEYRNAKDEIVPIAAATYVVVRTPQGNFHLTPAEVLLLTGAPSRAGMSRPATEEEEAQEAEIRARTAALRS